MLKIMQEELLNIAVGYVSINTLVYESRLNLTSDATSLIISASLKRCQSVVIYSRHLL
jgi:hypothetical protein